MTACLCIGCSATHSALSMRGGCLCWVAASEKPGFPALLSKDLDCCNRKENLRPLDCSQLTALYTFSIRGECDLLYLQCILYHKLIKFKLYYFE